jgi:hypothetical protein
LRSNKYNNLGEPIHNTILLLDDEFRPKKIDEYNLKIFDDSLPIPLKIIGCNISADEILQEWNVLETNGFPLIHISRLLMALELIDRERGGFYILPMLIHLIKIICAIHCIRLVSGGNERINKLKKELSSLVFNATEGAIEQRKIANDQIINKILSYSDEFQIGCILHKLYLSLKANTGKGPDFLLDDLGIKIEAKSKLNRRYLGRLWNPSIPIDKITCLKLMSKDVFESGRLEEAFEHQDTDIAIMNESHSQFGALFAAHAYSLDNLNLELSKVFEEAIITAKSKGKVVVLYSEQLVVGEPYSICAIASQRDIVEYYGANLDKIEKDLKINTKTTKGYYRLIDEARKLN